MLTEPSVVELAAARMDDATLASLSRRLVDLTALADNTPMFIRAIFGFERLAFSAVGNPALSVAVEMMHWVSVRAQRALTVSALSAHEVVKSNRLTCRRFEEALAAVRSHDAKPLVELGQSICRPSHHLSDRH